MKYDVIYADPPWDYYGDPNKMGAAGKYYPLMSDQELLDIDLPLAKPGILFLWATGPRLDFAQELINAWDLHYRGVAFVWVKTKPSDPLTPIGAQGVRPSIVKPTTEFVLAASTEKRGRPLKIAKGAENVRQVVMEPKRVHSRKPDIVRDEIARMYPNYRKLELFARQQTEGWDTYGNETSKFS